MKHVSKKAIDTLTADNIHSECCRGPITDAIPDLAGVKPRGWPEHASWDEVPGVYSGDKKKLVVGTFEKGGKREVPKAGEGPIPHGASDLYGHEAGHAFDAANGSARRARRRSSPRATPTSRPARRAAAWPAAPPAASTTIS